MPDHAAHRHRARLARRSLALAAAALATAATLAQAPGTPRTAAPNAATEPARSALDAPLFYQLLIGEIELRNGAADNAHAVLLDAARRTRDESLFKRSVDVALQARAGDQALAAARAWRQTLPQSSEALRYELQLLAALNRSAEVAEPLKLLLARTPETERAALIATLPRLFQRAGDKRQAAVLIEDLLQPYTQAAHAPATRTAAHVASGRAWWLAGDAPRALQQAERAQAQDPSATGPVLLALDLLTTAPGAQSLVANHLQRPGADVAVQLAYVRALSGAQRYVDAIAQLTIVTRDRPELAAPWLTLGALQLELRQSRDAESSLQRFLGARAAAASAGPVAAPDSDDDEDDSSRGNDGGQTQAWLMLAQAADQRGDAKAANAWLDKIDNPQRALEVQTRRAMLLARQGKLRDARVLVQQVPERRPEDARAKLLAESQVLREVKRWNDAHAVLVAASERFPGDADLLYEQAMMAEKLLRIDEMERVLRQVIEIKPDHHHAYNALGYSLADRSQRLPEAQALIKKALDLAPGDPFITDSLGWVEFRLGNRDEALRLLRQAYASRPDSEIAAHLGEVLWMGGARDEARRVWRDGRERDAANEVLRETLTRLQVKL
ncbi:MAG: tetratricopeptide repeat protein [Burkholderiaceae bacterium]|nr:tetratricopeptide repeat protein [Burkholderiaceae bacterium]